MSEGKPSLHDWLIDKLANTNGFGQFAKENGFEIAKNPTGQQNRGVKLNSNEMWPDVVVFDPKTNYVKRLGEVETEETVTIDHAKGHWDLYGKAASGDLVLAIPNGSVDAAKEIIQQLQVSCRIWTYKLTQDAYGNIADAEFESI
jgi:hypothetical protein